MPGMIEDDCVHHWVLEAPDGRPKVSGECLKCGTIRYNAFKTAADTWGAMSGDDLHFIFAGPSLRGKAW